MIVHRRSRQAGILLAGVLTCLPLLLGQGCPQIGPVTGTVPEVTVTAPSFDLSVTAGDTLSVVYDVVNPAGGSTSVGLFYDRDGVLGTGDEVLLTSGLPTGTMQFTTLATEGIAPGRVHVGIIATNSAGSTQAYASGVLTVSESAVVTATAPAQSISVGPGTVVPIQFEVAAQTFDFRVFYDRDGALDGDEVTISLGSSDDDADEPTQADQPVSIATSFNTTGLPVGTYYIGVTLTLDGGAQSTVYFESTVSVATGAFIQVLAPTVGAIVRPGDFLQIVVAANDPANPNADILVFYDFDDVYDNGNEVEIEVIDTAGAGASWDTRSVSPGNYYIGAALQNGLEPPPVSYSAGPVQVGVSGGGDTGLATLNLPAPTTQTLVLSGNPYRINWTTTLQEAESVVTLFLEPDLDEDGEPDGEETRETIVEGLDAAVQFYNLDTEGIVGNYFIGAILTPNDGEIVEAYTPATLKIIPKTLWVGGLGSEFDEDGNELLQQGPFYGAVFRGHNLQDNLGSAMLGADDYDRDGRTDFVLAAQFGKPYFAREGGRGAGEAYFIYGSGSRFAGDYQVNNVGTDDLPGLIMPGIVPNPYAGDDETAFTEFREPFLRDILLGRAGNSIPYMPDGRVTEPYASEGLRSIALIPDQDGDGIAELAFGFPFCNSLSLYYQQDLRITQFVYPGAGRLENNGHFLRGGLVIVSSRNPLMRNREVVNRTGDRTLSLHEVGQLYDHATTNYMTQPNGMPYYEGLDFCPVDPGPDGFVDTVSFPCEGFWQDTAGLSVYANFDPPRLAEPIYPFTPFGRAILKWGAACREIWAPTAVENAQHPYGLYVSLNQVDPPTGPQAGPTSFHVLIAGPPAGDPRQDCTVTPPVFGEMSVIGTGFYTTGIEGPAGEGTQCVRTFLQELSPYGARILGQSTTQPRLDTRANLFGASISVSGNYLLVGAPLRTAEVEDVPTLPTDRREESGTVYMLRLTNYWNRHDALTAVPSDAAAAESADTDADAADDQEEEDPLAGGDFGSPDPSIPTPHNYIIEDVGYSTLDGPGCTQLWPVDGNDVGGTFRGGARIEMEYPFHIVGAAPGDQVGEVTGLYDINGDGLSDFMVGAPRAVSLPEETSPRGAVYVIYRRPPEIENSYLLEDLARNPATDPNRLNGLMIIGEQGQTLGRSMAGGGALNDDYNNDGNADVLIGNPEATNAGGVGAGEVFVLFGGRNLLSPQGGVTISELVASGDGMRLIGVEAGDTTGLTVANVGDFNGDDIPDIGIVAPDASPRFDSDGDGLRDTIGLDLNGDGQADDLNNDGITDDLTNAGVVYVVFGGDHLTGTISLALVGTRDLPGLTVVGRKAGYHLGGGIVQNGLASNGLASGGDIDGDGRSDLLVSSVLADPENKTNAGEVYLVYGFQP